MLELLLADGAVAANTWSGMTLETDSRALRISEHASPALVRESGAGDVALDQCERCVSTRDGQDIASKGTTP